MPNPNRDEAKDEILCARFRLRDIRSESFRHFAESWLSDLENRLESGERPEILLRSVEKLNSRIDEQLHAESRPLAIAVRLKSEFIGITARLLAPGIRFGDGCASAAARGFGKLCAYLVVCGLLGVMIGSIPIAVLLFTIDVFGYSTWPLAECGCGALGALTSLILRLRPKSGTLDISDATVLFCQQTSTGFRQCTLGAVFGFVAFLLVTSGRIPLTIETEQPLYTMVLVCFAAGFAERAPFSVFTAGRIEEA